MTTRMCMCGGPNSIVSRTSAYICTQSGSSLGTGALVAYKGNLWCFCQILQKYKNTPIQYKISPNTKIQKYSKNTALKGVRGLGHSAQTAEAAADRHFCNLSRGPCPRRPCYQGGWMKLSLWSSVLGVRGSSAPCIVVLYLPAMTDSHRVMAASFALTFGVWIF